MAYVLEALVGRLDEIGGLAARLGGGGAVGLPEGLALFALRRRGPGTAVSPAGEACLYLPDDVRSSAVEVSRTTPIAYLEAELWAGEGIQAALVWADGEVVLGPLTSDLEGTLADRPINQALRRLGVTRGDEVDEFAAAGLGRHRSTEAWH